MEFVASLIKKHLLIRALHCVCLSRSCLTVGEDAHIVSVETRLYKRLDLIEYVSLRATRSKDAIKEVAVVLSVTEIKLQASL